MASLSMVAVSEVSGWRYVLFMLAVLAATLSIGVAYAAWRSEPSRRELRIGAVLITGAVALGNITHLNTPLTWSSWVLLVGLVVFIFGTWKALRADRQPVTRTASAASPTTGFWGALDRFRTSKWGVLLFYGYIGGIFVAAVVAVVAINGNHAIAVKAKNAATAAGNAAALANRSLCFQKEAAVGQLRAARTFLRKNPQGTVDFSRAVILNAIHSDEVDVAALRDIHCPPEVASGP